MLLACPAALAQEAQPREAPPQPAHDCTAAPLTDVQVSRCTLDRCRDPQFQAALVTLADLPRESAPAPSDLERARQRLLDTGLFTAVRLDCLGTALALDLEGKTLVRRVSVEGNRNLYESDILKRTYIKAGQYLDEVRPGAEVFRSQQRAIEALYTREGFEGTRVQVVPETLPGNEVEVHLRITPGRRSTLTSVQLALEQPEEGAGCPRFATKELEREAGLRAGDVYREKDARKARRTLMSYLWARGVVSPHVALAVDRDSGALKAEVRFQHCYALQFWSARRDPLQPYAPDDPDDYLPYLTFKDGGSFDWEEAEITRGKLVDMLRSLGYVEAAVSMQHRTRPRANTGAAGQAGGGPIGPPGGAAVLGQIDFFIDRGPRFKIEAIQFHGNRHFSGGELREGLEVEEYSLFSQGGFLLVDQVFSDLGRIAERYRADGYYAFAFPGALGQEERRVERRSEAGREWWAWTQGELAFQVERPPGSDAVTLHVLVEEGPAAVLEEVAIAGSSTDLTRKLRKVLALNAGGPWSDRAFQKLQSDLKRFYSARGYSLMSWTATCSAQEPEVPEGSCDPVRLMARRITLRLAIEEGTKARVTEVVVLGNLRTSEGFIRSHLPRAGQPYDVQSLDEGANDLRNSGIFSSVHVKAVGPEESPPSHSVALVAFVEETTSRFVDLAVGFETINRPEESAPPFVTTLIQNSVSVADVPVTGSEHPFLGGLPDLLITTEASFTDRNFLGRARELFLPVKYGFSMTSPFRYASFQPTYTDPYFTRARLLFRAMPFVVYDRATESIDKFLFGLNLSVSKSLARSLYGTLSYEISEITYRLPPYTDAFSPLSLQNKVSPRLTLNRLDNPVNPTAGSFVSASTSYLNAFVSTAGGSSGFNNYVKWELLAKLFVPVRSWFVIGSMGRYADSHSFEGQDLPDTERYLLGGSKGLRGYVDDGVHQYTLTGAPKVRLKSDGTYELLPGGDMIVQGSEELRVPVWRAAGLWVGGFFDWGGLAETWADLHLKSIRTSAGLGIRWLLGGQVPLRVDYGFKLDRRCEAIDPESRQCVRQESLGALHFGLLYTF
jgi:outer membrane protein assembly factor BamA